MEDLDLNTLLKNLKDEDEAERIYAAEDLGMLGESAAIDPLLAQFAIDDSVAVREAISQALHEFENPIIVEKVCEWLYSNVAATRNYAVRFLQSKGELNCDFLESLYTTDQDPDIRKFIIDAAMKFSPENCKRFIVYGLKDEDINVRIASVEYAGQRQLEDLEDHIIELLKDTTEPMLMSSVLEALSNFDDAKTFDAIKERFATLSEEELYYAPWIARFYGTHGRPEDLAYLLHLLETCPGQVDGVLAEGISSLLLRFPEIPLPMELYPWFEALFEQSQDDNAINNALNLLSKRYENEAASQLLTGALNSFSLRSRLLAINTISSSEARTKLLPELEKRLRHEDDAEAKEALENAIG